MEMCFSRQSSASGAQVTWPIASDNSLVGSKRIGDLEESHWCHVQRFEAMKLLEEEERAWRLVEGYFGKLPNTRNLMEIKIITYGRVV